MLDKIEFVKPGDIEARSMEIITGELGDTAWKEPELSVVRRCIHTSADFDYNINLKFSGNSGPQKRGGYRYRYPDGHVGD